MAASCLPLSWIWLAETLRRPSDGSTLRVKAGIPQPFVLLFWPLVYYLWPSSSLKKRGEEWWRGKREEEGLWVVENAILVINTLPLFSANSPPPALRHPPHSSLIHLSLRRCSVSRVSCVPSRIVSTVLSLSCSIFVIKLICFLHFSLKVCS